MQIAARLLLAFAGVVAAAPKPGVNDCGTPYGRCYSAVDTPKAVVQRAVSTPSVAVTAPPQPAPTTVTAEDGWMTVLKKDGGELTALRSDSGFMTAWRGDDGKVKTRASDTGFMTAWKGVDGFMTAWTSDNGVMTAWAPQPTH